MQKKIAVAIRDGVIRIYIRISTGYNFINER